MKKRKGILQRISGALARNNVNIETVNQGHSESTVILGVEENDTESKMDFFK
jgi:aspartokinase